MTTWLLVTPDFPPATGGVARYLGVLVEGDARLAVASPAGERPFDFTWKGFPRWLPLLWRMQQRITSEDADALLISHVLPLGYGALISYILGTPYTVICHGLDLTGPLRNPWKRFWAGIILGTAERVIVNSAATRALALRYGIREANLRVVHPPLSWDPKTVGEEPETDFAARHELAGKDLLLVVGRLVPRKGVDVAIRSLPLMRPHESKVTMLVIGEGPERGRLETLAVEAGVRDQVIFAGAVSDAELRDAYRAARIVLCPSIELPGDFEGFGIAAADAGTFAKPVVASRTGGLAEAVADRKTGLLVPPGDADALAAAVQSILADDALAASLGEEAQRRAVKRTHTAFRKEFFEALA